MKVQFSICFRCAPRAEVFWSARADALKMQNHADPRTCSKTRVPTWMVSRLSALIAEHVLTGATQLLGAGNSQKTPVFDGTREFLSLTRTLLNLGAITLLVPDGPCLS